MSGPPQYLVADLSIKRSLKQIAEIKVLVTLNKKEE